MSLRIAVLGLGIALHRELVSRGVELTLFCVGDDMSHVRTSDYAQVVVLQKDAAPAMWAELFETLHAARPFDRCYTLDENYAYAFAEIARRHAAICWPDAAAKLRTTDKNLMRASLAQAGVGDLAYGEIATADQLDAVVAAVGYPCIVKPKTGQASVDVFKLTTAADTLRLRQRLLQLVGEKPFVCETFIEGPEYSVEAVSENGEHFILGITEKFKLDETFLEIGHLFPAPNLDAGEALELRTKVKETLTGLGVTDAITHTEIVFSPDGPKVIETHLRPGGDRIADLVERATGVNVFKLAASQLLGEPIASQVREVFTQRSAAVWFLAPSRAGTVEQTVIGAEARRAGVELLVDVAPGAKVERATQSFQRVASALFVHNDPFECLNAVRGAIGAVDVQLKRDGADAVQPAGGAVKPVLFLLQPGFHDDTGGPFFCPDCALVDGFLGYAPELARELEIRRVGIARPRPEIVLRIGAAHQSCPVLVLEDAAELPPEGQRSAQTGTVFVAGPTAICNYLARRAGANLPVPHP